MKQLAFILLILTSLVATAQKFTAKVSKDRVAVGENFQVSFESEGKISSFSPPPFEEFAVLSGPNKSSSMQWINGNFSQSISYSYILQAQADGAYTIQPAHAKINGKDRHTEPIVIEVYPSRARAQANQRPQNQARKQAPRTAPSSQEDLSTSLFLKLFVSDKSPYVGEQITATYKLYLSTQIVEYLASRPVYNGFYAQELEVDPSKDLKQEVINGKQFTVATMKKVVLTPQSSGELEIPPLDMEAVVRVAANQRNRNLFDQFFGSYKNVRVEIESNPETINVKALPSQGQPADFIGAVGDFDLSVNTDRQDVGVNEAINLTVELKGKGNLELISIPEVSFPRDFEAYDPKTKQNIKLSSSGTQGSKSFEYVIIPRYEGDFELEPIHFSYFDPNEEAYKKLVSEPIKINVIKTGGGDPDEVAYVAPKKEDVQILGKDIRFIKTTSSDLQGKQEPFFSSPLFYAISTLPFAGMGSAIFLFFFIRAQNADEENVRRRRAGGIAKKHLNSARKLINESDEVFFEAISNALFGYIGDKLSIATSELSRDRIEDELKIQNVNAQTLDGLKKALDECEMVRFAPGVVRSKEEMLEESARIIEQLENELA